MQKLIISIAFIFFILVKLFAQQSSLDSLLHEIALAKQDSSKVKLYLKAGKEIIFQNTNTAISFYKTAANLSIKSNYTIGAGLCYLSLGNAYSLLSKTDSSLLYMDTALPYLRQLNSAQYLGNFFGNRADTYVQISDFKKALLDCDTATMYIEQSGKTLHLAFIYNIRADIYWHLKQYQLNFDYVEKALAIHLQTGNMRMVGQAYADKGDWHAITKNYNSAVVYYKKAISIADSINDESNLSRYHSLLSDTYLEMNKKTEAVASALKSLKYAQQEENPVQEALVHTLLCRIYTRQNNVGAAVGHGRLGHYTAMQEIDLPLQQSSAAALAEAFKKAGSLDSAYLYLQKSKDLNDSLITKNFNKETANLQIGFAVSQKEKQIALLTKDNIIQEQEIKRQQGIKIGAIVVAMLSILGIWLAVNRYRLRQKMKELELRNQIAADLHDEVGSSLSSIHMLSQMANTNLAKDNQKNILNRVSTNAKETMDRMSDIVWMIKPGETEAGSLKQRMERFAFEICGSKNIILQIDVAAIEDIKLTMEQRKNIYLIFKEAVNNAVKYSGTEKIAATASIQNKQLAVVIKDFGKGFEQTTTKRGNGLENMQHRAKEISGLLLVESVQGSGTQIKLFAPV
jgi:two-component system, NarL family, sensor histidine kinase UhpB